MPSDRFKNQFVIPLSIGQIQIVSLCRGILRDVNVLLLDEIDK